MNYIITGGTGFIGTHLANLIAEKYPHANIYNLDIVEPGTPLPTVKNYKPALKSGEKHKATFIYCDVRKTIEVPFEVTADDVIFNFAAVHRTPGHPDYEYFETNIKGAENVCAFAEKYGIKKIVWKILFNFLIEFKPTAINKEIITDNGTVTKVTIIVFGIAYSITFV